MATSLLICLKLRLYARHDAQQSPTEPVLPDGAPHPKRRSRDHLASKRQSSSTICRLLPYRLSPIFY